MAVPNEWVSVREYSRRRGVSHTAIQKAVLSGRIASTSVRKNPKHPSWTQVNPALADADLVVNTDEGQVREKVRQPGPERDPDPEQGRLFEAATPAPEASDESGRVQYAKSRAVGEAYRARMEREKYLEMVGSKVDAREVAVERFRTGRVVRESMLNIPSRVADELAAETDAATIHQRLTEEIKIALVELTRQGRMEGDGDSRATG